MMFLTKRQKLVISLIVTFAAALIGSIFTAPSVNTWYSTLQKPFFTPPNWAFGPVWTTLYFLMGLSFYFVWIKKSKKGIVKKAIKIYSTQLTLNVLWSVIFFGFRNILGGVLVISALWVSILITIHRFYKLDKKAAYLLIPYILWVSLASFLNYFLWVLNI